ncbi:MAG: zinc-binding dehydrogenase [Pseudonocardiaceae bacterium]
MRAIQITETGGPDVLRLAEPPDPEPGLGQLLVEVTAAGVNYIDTYYRSGAYPTALPFIPGAEGAGILVVSVRRAAGPGGRGGGGDPLHPDRRPGRRGPPVDPQRLSSAGSVFLTRPALAHYVVTREELTWRAAEVFDAILDGSLRIIIGGRYPLAEASRAHQDLQGRRTTGKLLLLPG